MGLSGLQLIAVDREQRAIGVLRILEGVARGDVAGEINALAVGRESRLPQLLLKLLVGALYQLDAGTAVDVVEPHLTGPERAPGGKMLLGDNVTAVGAPARLIEQAEVFLRQLLLVRAVGPHDPDVVAAGAIRDEGDAPTVRRPARLLLIGQSLGDARWRAARDRHDIDVAEHVEHDAPAVRRHVDVHPGAFVRADRHLAKRQALRSFHVPLCRVGLDALFRRRCRWRSMLGRCLAGARVGRRLFLRLGNGAAGKEKGGERDLGEHGEP